MSKCGELLKTLSERKISGNTRVLCSDPMRNMTDQQKEIRAGQILSILNRSKDEQSFISAMKNMNLI